MALVLPGMADHACAAIRNATPGRFVGVHFGYAPSPERFLVVSPTIPHCDVLTLLRSTGHVDLARFRVGTIAWFKGNEMGIEAYDTNPTELAKLPVHVRSELMQQIRLRL